MKNTVSVFLWVAAVAQFSTVSSNLLEDFHRRFSTASQHGGQELEYFRGSNSALIKEFNRELLLSFGRMIPALRTADAEFVESLSSRDNVTEECLDYVMELRDFLVQMQNYDVQNCAYFAGQSLQVDTANRFWPYHHLFAREFIRATTQVIDTLSRNRLDKDQGAIEVELDEAVDYFDNLQVSKQQVLWDEIVAHADMADATYRSLEECRELTKLMQKFDHEYLIGELEYCVENSE